MQKHWTRQLDERDLSLKLNIEEGREKTPKDSHRRHSAVEDEEIHLQEAVKAGAPDWKKIQASSIDRRTPIPPDQN